MLIDISEMPDVLHLAEEVRSTDEPRPHTDQEEIAVVGSPPFPLRDAGPSPISSTSPAQALSRSHTALDGG